MRDGIVLVWSKYDPVAKTSLNADWQCHFVPRAIVGSSHSGGRYQMHFAVGCGESSKIIGDKVLMVGDWSISGRDCNSGKRSVNGFEVDHGIWVLRSIIAI